MAVTVWNVGNAINYVEIVSQAFAVARGGGVKNFFNIYHFRRTTTSNPLVRANVQTAFQTAVMVPVLAALNVDYTQTNNTLRFFENPTDAPIAVTQAGVGAISGDRLPDFSAVVVQLKTGVRGKVGRGSKHYGPIAESDTTGDDLVSGSVTRFQAVGAAIVAGFTDSDGNVWIPGLKGAPRLLSPAQYVVAPTTTVWTDITSYLLNKSLGTMKRRKIKTVN
jgi:hypothetical protein